MSLLGRLLVGGLLLPGLALVPPGCSWLIPREGIDPSPDDGGAPAAALSIARVDGSGSERPVSAIPPDLEGAVPGARRLRDVLVVDGEGLRQVTKVSLASAAGASRYEDLDFERFTREGASDVSLRVSLPTGVRAGLYTLTLLAASHEAGAQVYLLQGEPGPPGPSGARGPAGIAAPAGLTRVLPLVEGDPACARGGARVLVGTDRDADGYLDDDEVETAAPLCHGDPGLECTDGVCVLAAALDVEGEIHAGGPDGFSLPLVRQVTTSFDVVVGPGAAAHFPSLPVALAALDAIRIAPPATVTLRLEAGEHVVSSAIVLRHPDARRIRILGADETAPAATVITVAPLAPSHGVHVPGTGLGALNGLTLRNVGPRGGHGVIVDGGRAALGPALVIEGFDVGVSAYHGGEVIAHGTAEAHLSVTGHVIGFFSQEASLHANFASATAPLPVANTSGFHATLGGRIYAASFHAAGHTFGALASTGSLIYAPTSVVVGPGNTSDTKGYLAQYGSSIEATGSVVTNAMFGYQAVYQATIIANGHGTLTGTTRPYCGVGNAAVLVGVVAHQTCP